MAKLPNVSELTECPHCNGTTYYYMSQVSKHITTWVNFDGSDADNSEMFTSLNSKAMKFIFCADCHKKIAKNDCHND